MLAKVKTFATRGIEGVLIEVEVFLSPKTPRFSIVGLPDAAIREAKDRVKAAMSNCEYLFPYKRILINLAPADIKKQGPQYDLPIALGLLGASGQIPLKLFDEMAFVGELALDGSIRPVKGVLSMVEAAYKAGLKKMTVPEENANEASIFGMVEVYPVKDLKDAVLLLTSPQKREPTQYRPLLTPPHEKMDYLEISGQEYSKRAMLIAAAGEHHCLMIGPPGSGKTMLARRIPTILPMLCNEEIMETCRIYSIAGMLSNPCLLHHTPPFRAPHHTISSAGMAGGGCNPRPGEISLAHNGVLFLDELAEFPRDTLEVLRQPLESGSITISRAKENVTYPAQILLLAALNPCPCGYLGDTIKPCRCTSYSIDRYRRKISGPLLDRFDIQIQVSRIKYRDLVQEREGTDSATMKAWVAKAREVQKKRLAPHGLRSNGQITPRLIKKYCIFDREAGALLDQAIDGLGLSARAYHKILKVSRTIADLEGCDQLNANHISEAIQYRSLDRMMG